MTFGKTAVGIGALAIVTAVFACGTDAATDPGGAEPEPEGTTPAKGGGVCCPIDNNPCSPGWRGGWAATARECEFDPTYDGRWTKYVEKHDCVTWTTSGAGTAIENVCCGCPLPPIDASSDASDAASDAGSTDASDASDASDSG